MILSLGSSCADTRNDVKINKILNNNFFIFFPLKIKYGHYIMGGGMSRKLFIIILNKFYDSFRQKLECIIHC